MSTALAIAATTRVIASLIDDSVAAANLGGILGVANTTASSPDHITTGETEQIHLNLFLYQVTYNPGWREVGLPSRNSAGDGVDRPPLALDLHYLLCPYGAGDFEPEILLGIGMQALHETPLLYRQKIRDVFKPPPLNDIDKALATAALADQIEMIKIASNPLSTEELSKLWTAFQAKFRTSAAYLVSVLLIESKAPIRSALPVLSRNLAVVPFQDPSIDSVDPQVIAYAPALQLRVSGQNLAGDRVVVIFDGNPTAPQTPDVLAPGGALISISVPPLAAGINTLRVVRQLAIGAPPIRNILESNVGMFILQPVIQRDLNPPHNDLITVGPPDSSASPPITPITVALDPTLSNTQRVSLLLNEMNPPPNRAPRSYTFEATPDTIGPNSVKFAVRGVEVGPHLVRVRVDGAESPLRTDPSTGSFVAPQVTL